MRKGTITEGGKKINWQQTADGVAYADGKIATPSPDNMGAKLAYKTAKLPDVEPPKPEPPISTVKLDHVYLASQALNATGRPDENGDNAQVIPDSAGNYPLKYAGIAAPILTGGSPIFRNGEIEFDNEPNSLFNTDRFDKLANYPYEETLVLRVVPGTGFEQFQNDWNNDLSIGDSGGKLRAGDADVNAQTFAGSDYEFFKVMVIHVLAEAGKQTMWLNGKNIGSISSRTSSRKWLNSIGVGTNNAQWNFIAKYVKLSKFSDSDRSSHLTAVMAQFKPGSKPAAPYASDVSIVKGAAYTAKYTYNGVLPQDVAKTEFRWLGYGNPGGLGGVKIIGTGATLPLSATAYPINSLRVDVKVYDTSGNSFRYVSMPFTNK